MTQLQPREVLKLPQCGIFRPAFVCWTCWAPQTLVEIVIFRILFAEKLKKCKKETNLKQNFAKKWVFQVCTKTLAEWFIPKKLAFYAENDYFNQRFGCAAG